MRYSIMAVAALSCMTCNSTADAAPFAIACTGNAQFTDKLGGKESRRTYELPQQVYVFDEGAKRVQRALIPRQEFEDVCIRGGYVESVIFSPGLISVRSEKADYMCDFKVNRKTGDAELYSHSDFAGNQFSEIEFKMTCSPTEMPVFDPSKNRF